MNHAFKVLYESKKLAWKLGEENWWKLTDDELKLCLYTEATQWESELPIQVKFLLQPRKTKTAAPETDTAQRGPDIEHEELGTLPGSRKYYQYTCPQLRQMLLERGLSPKNNLSKPRLVEMLLDDDNSRQREGRSPVPKPEVSRSMKRKRKDAPAMGNGRASESNTFARVNGHDHPGTERGFVSNAEDSSRRRLMESGGFSQINQGDYYGEAASGVLQDDHGYDPEDIGQVRYNHGELREHPPASDDHRSLRGPLSVASFDDVTRGNPGGFHQEAPRQADDIADRASQAYDDARNPNMQGISHSMALQVGANSLLDAVLDSPPIDLQPRSQESHGVSSSSYQHTPDEMSSRQDNDELAFDFWDFF